MVNGALDSQLTVGLNSKGMKKILFLFVATYTLSACLKNKTSEFVEVSPVTCVDTVFFQDEIMGEIMNVSCNTAGCHNAGTNAGGYVLENYSQVAGSAAVLAGVMNYTAGLPMPQGSPKLADSLLQKFDCWIEQGKLDN